MTERQTQQRLNLLLLLFKIELKRHLFISFKKDSTKKMHCKIINNTNF